MAEKLKRRSKIEVPRQYASEEVETALKGIEWKIGDPEQIYIRDVYARIIKLKESEAGDVIRKKELRRLTMSQARRKRDIAAAEQQILFTIQRVKEKQANPVPISTTLSPDDIPL